MNPVHSIRICNGGTVHIRRDNGVRVYRNVHGHRITTLLRAITARAFSTFQEFSGIEFWRY